MSIVPYYQEDGITIYNCDCMEVMRGYADKSFDLVVTDPPYGIGIASKPFRNKFEKDNWDEQAPGKEVFDEIFRVSKEQVIWGGNYFGLPPTRGFLIWDKQQPMNFSSAMCEFAWTSRNAPAKIYRKQATSFKKYHPTTKPEELIAWCIGFFDCNTVLDPFMGSGTTLVVAKMLGKQAVGIEIKEEYCATAVKRLKSVNLALDL